MQPAAHDVEFCARGKDCKCGNEDLFLEVNTFKATSTPNFSNFTCVSQFCRGDRFDIVVVIGLILWCRPV